MATFDFPVTPRLSLVFQIALNMAMFYSGHAILDTPVHVKVATPKWDAGSLPDQLTVAIQDDLGWKMDVVLNRAKHVEPNIPVYTFSTGYQGEPEYKLAELEDNQNVAYYQSVDHSAAMQVTTVEGLGHKLDYLLNGDLVVNGTRCSLAQGHQAKRDADSTDDLVYVLQELPQMPGIIDDVHSVAQPQERDQFQTHNSGMPSASSSSERLSGTLFSRVAAHRSKNLFVDVVAVADHARYSRFTTKNESGPQTLQKMREHYNSVFNSVDNLYQQATGLDHSIHVQMVSLVVHEKPSSPWSTDLFRDGYKVDGYKALDALVNKAVNYGNPFLPYDHLMFFTGYNLTKTNGDLLGIAWSNSLCGQDSLSIVEDIKFDVVMVAAHELGHALSAQHDGYDNHCNPNSDIMASKLGTRQKKRFSKCSVRSFNTFINDLLETTGNCLQKKLPVRNRRSGYSKHLPGQQISFDENSGHSDTWMN